MVRQWQEFFYDKRYAATPMTGPNFVKLAEAYRLKGLLCDKRSDVQSTVEQTSSRPNALSSSTSSSRRKTRCSRWFPPAPHSTR